MPSTAESTSSLEISRVIDGLIIDLEKLTKQEIIEVTRQKAEIILRNLAELFCPPQKAIGVLEPLDHFNQLLLSLITGYDDSPTKLRKPYKALPILSRNGVFSKMHEARFSLNDEQADAHNEIAVRPLLGRPQVIDLLSIAKVVLEICQAIRTCLQISNGDEDIVYMEDPAGICPWQQVSRAQIQSDMPIIRKMVEAIQQATKGLDCFTQTQIKMESPAT